jgi:hypothetical protein
MPLRAFYGMWPQYDRRLREVIGAMTDEQLAIRPSPDRWPIWATVGHTAGTRVYWLCKGERRTWCGEHSVRGRRR